MKENASATHGKWSDPDDAPELTGRFFEQADLYKGARLLRRGRPPAAVKRPTLNMRVDADVLARLRGLGRGWQTRVNALLKRAVETGNV